MEESYSGVCTYNVIILEKNFKVNCFLKYKRKVIYYLNNSWNIEKVPGPIIILIYLGQTNFIQASCNINISLETINKSGKYVKIGLYKTCNKAVNGNIKIYFLLHGVSKYCLHLCKVYLLCTQWHIARMYRIKA